VKTVVVITTGGTIASRSDASGAKVAGVADAALLRAVPTGVDLQVRNVLSLNSAAMTLSDMDDVRRAVADALAAGADGVVVTHGTDTMEETAFLLELMHDDPRPVVFTGAQRRRSVERRPSQPARRRAGRRLARRAGNGGARGVRRRGARRAGYSQGAHLGVLAVR